MKLTFDGRGVNNADDEYKPRVATLTDHGHKLQAGPLLAAAPDLLTACEQFLALWPVLPGRDEPKAMPEVIATWRAARAAIAKAEGRS